MSVLKRETFTTTFPAYNNQNDVNKMAISDYLSRIVNYVFSNNITDNVTVIFIILPIHADPSRFRAIVPSHSEQVVASSERPQLDASQPMNAVAQSANTDNNNHCPIYYSRNQLVINQYLHCYKLTTKPFYYLI